MAREIRIVIDKKTGKVKWDYSGFKGEECFREAEEIKRLLRERFGIDVEYEEVEKKPEAYITEEEEIREVAW